VSLIDCTDAELEKDLTAVKILPRISLNNFHLEFCMRSSVAHSYRVWDIFQFTATCDIPPLIVVTNSGTVLGFDYRCFPCLQPKHALFHGEKASTKDA
jgi:hypothetical protein